MFHEHIFLKSSRVWSLHSISTTTIMCWFIWNKEFAALTGRDQGPCFTGYTCYLHPLGRTVRLNPWKLHYHSWPVTCTGETLDSLLCSCAGAGPLPWPSLLLIPHNPWEPHPGQRSSPRVSAQIILIRSFISGSEVTFRSASCTYRVGSKTFA